MNTEFRPLVSAANNPFAAFLSPELVVAAHERMAARVAGVVHRPLDKPRLVKAGQEALAALDAEVDADSFDETATVLDSEGDLSDIVSGSSGSFIRRPVDASLSFPTA